MEINYTSNVKNVFKSKNEEELREAYNQKWIKLINQFERNKSILLNKYL